MKQHITVEQLNSLNRESQRKWWGFITGDKNHHNGEEQEVSERSTIGKMIEFLGKNWWLGLFAGKMDKDFEDGIARPFTKKLWEGELCDALWQTVKDKLNEIS